MTVGELRKKLEGLDDDIPVVTHGRDHSYNVVRSCGEEPAEGYEGKCYEFYGEEHMGPESTEILVFLVSAR